MVYSRQNILCILEIKLETAVWVSLKHIHKKGMAGWGSNHYFFSDSGEPY